MPYSEFQIKRHIEILDAKAVNEVEGTPEEPELTSLYMIVETQEEVDAHDAKLKMMKEHEECARICDHKQEELDFNIAEPEKIEK